MATNRVLKARSVSDLVQLKEQVVAYRKAARMNQAIFAKLAGVEKYHIRELEILHPISEDVEMIIVQYLATAPRPVKTRKVGANRPTSIYITPKLLVWARITDQPSSGVEAVRALRDSYNLAKKEQGLAYIPLIQLEVENALTLATRGAYRHNSK